MASSWKPSIFSSRPARSSPAAAEPADAGAGGDAAGTAPAASGSGTSGAPKPAAPRRGPLPSLAELGAFDGVSPAPAPRRSGRLTQEDLRRLAVPEGARARPVPPGKPEEPLARPKTGRSWHADTPFETVQTAEGVLLRKEAEAKARAQAQADAEAQAFAQAKERTLAAARQAETARRAQDLDRSEQAARRAGPLTPLAAQPQPPGLPPAPRGLQGPRGELQEVPDQPSQDQLGASASPLGPVAEADGGQAEPGAVRKTVPAVNVAWADLHAAVQAGWIRPEAAHALWARWLARKPLTHVEDDGAPLPPLPPLPPQAPAQTPGPVGMAADVGDRGADAPGEPPSEAPGDAPADVLAATPPGVPPEEPDPWPGAEEPARPAPEPPEAVEVEVLEPLERAHARRAAERAAQPAPVIQVTDVIEARPEKAPPPPAPRWIVGQCVIAMLAAVVTAVSVGLGHVLFGPAGAALAAGAWTVVVWRKTSHFQASGQALRAVLGAHLLLPLLALTVWQLQEAAGWWPVARPLDLFADAPLDTLTRAAPGLRLDWRWLALAGVPLAAAVIWLVRLRRPVMLGAVTALLWLVTFQAVAGVLETLGLAFHGMTVFMLLLGVLTLLGGFYIDLKSRAAGVADFARWPYLCGAVLLGVGWLSLSVVPGPLALVRYAGWLVFVAWALALARPSLVALALALAGFEAAFTLAKTLGSDLIGAAVWLGWLALTGGLLLWMLPRADRWARRWQFWMPQAWRKALARPSD